MNPGFLRWQADSGNTSDTWEAPVYLAEGHEIRTLNKYLDPYVHCGTVHNSQDVETA